ncbi:MAG TPA: methyltransferase domain-containing protein [Candidatus Limnocylindrales bacterium]|nr:methyltransferase domain-containing protein [Candidatus Limnocylindrales bacterium]
MRRSTKAEYLDGPLDTVILSGNLRDLARVNRWLGGANLSWRAIRPFIEIGRTTRIVDVGTGGGDIPHMLLRRDKHRHQLHVLATDVRAELVDVARATAAAGPSFEVRQDPPDRIDSPDGSVDVAHCSLVLHHLDADQAVALLLEMRRVATGAVVINDLAPGWHWWIGAWALTRALTRNVYTRHDAPLSVRRAYSVDEVRSLAEQAGLRLVARYDALPAYRYALVFVRA